jgi:hypothetical protein
MPIVFIIIGIIIIVGLVAFAMFFGLIGANLAGPKPSEGDKHTG